MDAYLYCNNELRNVVEEKRIAEVLQQCIAEAFFQNGDVPSITIHFIEKLNEKFAIYDICLFINIRLNSQNDTQTKAIGINNTLHELFGDKEKKLKVQIMLGGNISPKDFEVNDVTEQKNSKTEQKPVKEETLANVESYTNEKNLFIATEPHYSFENVILPSSVKDKIQEAVDTISLRSIIYDEWGLSEIEPHPSSAINFFGVPGTGKSMAAEAVAKELGKKIIKIKYAEIGSKFHGESEKNIKAAFDLAQRQGALLFFDEADSLLSSRLSSASSSSDVSMNLQRSQVLTCLDDFEGIVIFTTNKIETYDEAFLSRLISVEFTKPDLEARELIWKFHVLPRKKLNLPLADDIDFHELATKYEFVGRDIKKAVLSTATKAATKKQHGKDYVIHQEDFVASCDEILRGLNIGKGKSPASEAKADSALSNAIKNTLKQNKGKKISIEEIEKTQAQGE